MKVCPKCSLRHFDISRSRCVMCGAELAEELDPRIGTILGGRYRLDEVIGEGGMAIVYLAHHTLMGRAYAVKVMHGHFAGDDAQVERMRREARMTAALAHPNIIEIYDFGRTDDGCPFIVMELLRGRSLREVVREGKVALGRLIDLGSQMAQGLARAHDFGVVHRDVKPENVFVIEDAQGRELVKLVDFGIARQREDTHLTHRGELIGTPQYMAPDRALRAEATASSDLYSLGVVLYEMATGVLPFEANSPTGFVLKHLHETPRPPIDREPSLPIELDRLIRDLLAKDPIDRPVDAHQVVERLRTMSAGSTPFEPTTTIPAEPPAREPTIDAWGVRGALLDELVARAYRGSAPADVRRLMTNLRASAGRLRALSEEGVRAQQALDELARELRAKSEQLGHAVHVLAMDLSRAREEERDARSEAEARGAASAEAAQLYARVLGAIAEDQPERPDDELVKRARALAQAAEEWQRAEQSAERSSARAERSAAEVADLGFQIDALRAQLERLGGAQAEEGTVHHERLVAIERDRHALESELAESTARLLAPLRTRADLADAIAAIDVAGA